MGESKIVMPYDRTKQEAASIGYRLLVLVLLPVILIAVLVLSMIFAVLVFLGLIIDTLQLVFFGTTSALEWVGTLIYNTGQWIQGLVT